MQFSEVIGQKEVKASLVKMVNENHLSHALLFLGKEGSGALALAMAFAQFIVCEKVHPTDHSSQSGGSLFGETDLNTDPVFQSDSCGVCAACSKAAGLIHPDIHFTFPVITKKPNTQPISSDYIKEWREFILKNPYANSFQWLQFINAENRQGNITARECEDILRRLSFKSFESRYKVLILWMPESLGKEGNKLLKLLEEPPPDTLFILVAENESLILPTILSRTQLVKINRLSSIDIESALELKEGVSIEKASRISRLSGGNFLEALQLIQHDGDNWDNQLREWLNSILRTGPQAQVKWIDEIAKTGREKQKQFLRFFNHVLQQAIRITILGFETASKSESEEVNDLASRLTKFNHPQLDAIIQEIDTAVYHIERNANAKVLFHALTIRLYHIISNNSVILVT